ncbi:MAG: hypothetical protein M3512_14435 [Bacteroidota bacterium]|nr:hypothetical protein [Bacteroidota bacterium]
MFWSNKPTLPVTENDKEWIEDNLLWLSEEFGKEHFQNLFTITPTKDIFDYNFQQKEEDAVYLLNSIKELMQIEGWDIELMFYSEQTQEFSEGLGTTLSKNLKGNFKGSSGKYSEKEEGIKQIWIEIGQLKNTINLISTISHELSHYILLGENRIEVNDEPLTDLTAITYGFGIFLSNSKFNFNASNSGWRMNSQGYLPEQMIAYAMAWLTRYRDDSVDMEKYLNKSTYKYYKQSLDYIDKYPHHIRKI